MSGGNKDLPFRIELWDDAGRHIEEVIALALTSPAPAEPTTRQWSAGL